MGLNHVGRLAARPQQKWKTVKYNKEFFVFGGLEPQHGAALGMFASLPAFFVWFFVLVFWTRRRVVQGGCGQASPTGVCLVLFLKMMYLLQSIVLVSMGTGVKN